MNESLAAIETLYNLALLHSNEPGFSDLFGLLPKICSILLAVKHEALKDSKITAFFQSSSTKTVEDKTDKGVVSDDNVILVD